MPHEFIFGRSTYSNSKAGVLLNIPAGRVTRSLRSRFLDEHTAGGGIVARDKINN